MNLPSHLRILLKLLPFFLVAGAGCTTLEPAAPAEGGFNLRGKMGVVQEQESFSARFLWQQQGPRFTIDLWGPLGQGRMRLTGTERRVELREGDGTLISRGTPEAVMTRHLGWSLPLAVLPQWVRGRPAGGIPVEGRVMDGDGRLSGFSQLGWQVDLERYRPVEPADGELVETAHGAEPIHLPYRVTARREATRVRLAISEWQIQPRSSAGTIPSSR